MTGQSLHLQETTRAAPHPSLPDLFALAARRRAPLEVATSKASAPIAVVASEGDAGCLRVDVILPALTDDLAEGPVSCTLELDGRRWAFDAEVVRHAGQITLSRARRLRAAQRRTSPRISVPHGTTVLFSEGDRVFRREIVDLGASGLGVQYVGHDGEPAEGTMLAQVRFALPLGAAITAAAAVRHVRPAAPGGPPIAGMELLGLGEADSKRLDAWVRGLTRTRKREEAVRNAAVFAQTSVRLSDGRNRPATALDTDGATIALEEPDRDLAQNSVLPVVEVRQNSVLVVSLRAQIADIVTHRARPLQARLAWLDVRPEQLGRLSRLLHRLRD